MTCTSAVIIVEERGPAIETFEAFSEALKDAKLDAEDVDVGIVRMGLEFVKTLPETVATSDMLLITDLLSVAMLKRMEATNTIAKNKKDAMSRWTSTRTRRTNRSGSPRSTGR